MTETPKQTRSGRTRAAILAAARMLFAAQGYERTTVREIATRVGIDPALVIRYFGGKEALFAQAAVFDLRLPPLGEVAADARGEALVRHFLGVWEDAGAGLPVLLRSAASNAYAAERLREVFAGQVVPAIARAIAAPDAPERAGLISSQLLGLALCRYVLKLPPVVAMAEDRIVSEVGRAIQRYLDAAPP
jgi:AcrR family transcriptional regulator